MRYARTHRIDHQLRHVRWQRRKYLGKFIHEGLKCPRVGGGTTLPKTGAIIGADAGDRQQLCEEGCPDGTIFTRPRLVPAQLWSDIT